MVGVGAPVRQQAVDADGIDDGTRENMRTDFGALFEHYNRKLRIDLLQPDRRGKTGRPRTHDHNVELHALAFNHLHAPINWRPY
ncbi:hypothetical protein ASE29_18830 [Ensifer sp. Root74]|nr:hypothetical protein ASE29_18830 [Ensifer sp. Root74]